MLSGVKILDLTRVLSGPYASMILADLGAEVIKVEAPGVGDEARRFGPFKEQESAYFAGINRGKKSVTIDLHTIEGQEIIKKLAKQCDILIENFKPGTMAKFNLGYEELHKLHPHLIYASISGFGQTGPYSKRPAYDVIIQAMSGLASITGNEKPVRVGSSIADLNSAMFGVIGILAALHEVKQSGEGQQIDISMLDCQISLLENAISRYKLSGNIPGPLGSRHPSITPFQFFKAEDGYLVIAIGNDNLWDKLCESLNDDSLLNAKFETNDLRTTNHPELEEGLNKIFQKKKVAEWCEELGNKGIPCSPLYNIKEMIADPHVQSREMIVDVEHPVVGNFTAPNSPLKFSKKKLKLVRSPTLGEHTNEVLKRFGYSEEELNQLRKDKVI